MLAGCGGATAGGGVTAESATGDWAGEFDRWRRVCGWEI